MYFVDSGQLAHLRRRKSLFRLWSACWLPLRKRKEVSSQQVLYLPRAGQCDAVGVQERQQQLLLGVPGAEGFGLDYAQLSSPEPMQSLASEQIGGRLWKGWRRDYVRHAPNASKRGCQNSAHLIKCWINQNG